MSFFSETEQIKLRKSRTHQFHHINEEELPSSDPHIIPRSSKSTISSLFLSPFHNSTDPPTTSKKKGTSFRGLGCTAGAAQQVSVPAVIRASAEWEGKKVKKKKKNHQHKLKKEGESMLLISENGNGGIGNCMVMQDVWCGPGIGFSSDGVVGSVDCVVSAPTAVRRSNVNGNSNGASSSNSRGKIDSEKINQRERERERERERASCLGRRAAANPDTLSFLDSEPAFLSSRPEPEVFGSRYHRHVRHPSPEGLAEIMFLQNSLIMGGRLDRFSDWRLDIDHMSYEQLLELGERMGYVSTGLKEDEIGRCVGKLKHSIVNDLSSRLPVILDKKCTVCQEEYESDDELGKLECGHGFHIQCIKQWLAHKNICPVCKTEPVARG
ncbi:E3 ubiquitin-protein ligase MBR2-like [Mercurialis annua]|uniref:E3 ubiquitin-protein ligase MBR2-like n=1 Tax=Mercurialis annua TaxID=3986 RepID=UPI00215EFC30|nr:E3 ubiquitin-protein ligase MBR2-like [Mercurialis annua]